MPPGDGEDGGGGGSSSGRQLALVVGGLLAVAGGLSALTFLYWRRTRPVAYNAALDALGDLAGPVPVTPGGSAVAGEPTVLGPSVIAPVPSRTPEQATALLAALLAAEEGGAWRSGETAEERAPASDGPPVTGEVPPIVPGEAGFRVMGAVAASGIGAAGAETAAASPTEDETAPPESQAADVALAQLLGFEAQEFVTREDLEAPSPALDRPNGQDPLAALWSETESGQVPPAAPGPATS